MTELEEMDGWDYWGKVYEDPLLTAEARAQTFNEPTISELLSGRKLTKTRIIVENLVTHTTEAELKNLLEGELGRATVMRVSVGRYQATVEFYIQENARRAVALFDHRKIRGNYIRVKTIEDVEREREEAEEGREEAEEGSSGMVVESSKPKEAESRKPKQAEEKPVIAKAKEARIQVRVDKEEADEGIQNNGGRLWDQVERSFVEELVELLEANGVLEWNSTYVEEILRKEKYSPLVLFKSWTLGAFRLPRNEFKLIGPYLALPHQEEFALQLCSIKNKSYIEVEEWESQCPSTITTIVEFFTYMRLFLEKWGPVWAWDAKLALLVELLPPQFLYPPDVFTGPTANQMNIHQFNDTIYHVLIPTTYGTRNDAE